MVTWTPVNLEQRIRKYTTELLPHKLHTRTLTALITTGTRSYSTAHRQISPSSGNCTGDCYYAFNRHYHHKFRVSKMSGMDWTCSFSDQSFLAHLIDSRSLVRHSPVRVIMW